MVSSANGYAVVVVAVMTMSQSAPSDGNDKDKDWSLCHCRGTRWDCRLYPMTTNRIIVICSMAGENLQEWYRLRCAPVSVFHRRLPLHSWLLLLTQQRLLPSMLVNSFSRCHSFSFFPPDCKDVDIQRKTNCELTSRRWDRVKVDPKRRKTAHWHTNVDWMCNEFPLPVFSLAYYINIMQWSTELLRISLSPWNSLRRCIFILFIF